MAVNIENLIGRLLNDPALPSKERKYLEALRKENAAFLKANEGTVYPISPYNYGGSHVRSIAEIRLGDKYIMVERENEKEEFKEIGELTITDMQRRYGKDIAHGSFNLYYSMVYSGETNMFFGMCEAYKIGLEPIPNPKLSGFFLGWQPNVWLARMEEKK